MRALLIILSSLSLSYAYGQMTPKNFFPKEIRQVDLSSKKEAAINRQSELLQKDKLTKIEQNELDSLLEKYGEVVESIWNVIEGGCSWYCEGGNYSVKASSALQPEKGIVYKAENANDLSYKTAWVEGKDNEGIGEYLEYYFKNSSPRVTKIIISNGYMKSETAWKNNNRVKKLTLFVNGKIYGVLNLEDSRSDQVFDIGTFGRNKNGTDLILKFEILEIYKGDKFNDTAITEIYFDGLD
ncbi:MAG: NADase-type glycan-binding domain-containing protein, partial [Bacteroidota bacterium]